MARALRTPIRGRVAQEEPEETVPYGYAFHFLPMQDYAAGSLDRNEVLVFEYLLAIGQKFLNDGHTGFAHSYPVMSKRTGLSVGTIQRIVGELEDDGFITTELREFRKSQTTYYTINYVEIRSRMTYFFGGSDTLPKRDKLMRIRNRKIALRQMHDEKMRLEDERRKILGEED